MDVNHNSGTYTNVDNDYLKGLFERSTNMLTFINNLINETSKEQFEIENNCDTINSYVPMEVRKTAPTESMNRDGYVVADVKSIYNEISYENIDTENSDKEMETPTNDIREKYNRSFNDLTNRNIIGVYVKETIKMNNTDEMQRENIRGKYDCPFIGLPAKHLPIKKSPKIGWLTMHQNGKRRFSYGCLTKRKYYSGLVMVQLENEYCEWWLLLYANENDLKPRIFIQLNRFTVCADSKLDTSCEPTKQNPCKFKLIKKLTETNNKPKSYCFIAETSTDCDKWINLIKPLSFGLPYDEQSAPIRQLPMLPLIAENLKRQTESVDHVDHTDTNLDPNNITIEGIYEDPEACFGIASMSTNNTLNNYDTPTFPPRKLSNIDVSDIGPENHSTYHELNNMDLKSNHEILDTISNEQIQTNSQDEKMIDRQPINTVTKNNSTNIKQTSSVRNWFTQNRFTKLRQTTYLSNVRSNTSCRIHLTSETSKTEHIQHHKLNELSQSMEDHTKQRTINVQSKGNKVHQIINKFAENNQIELILAGSKCNTISKCKKESD